MMDNMIILHNGKEYRLVLDGAASSDSHGSVMQKLDAIAQGQTVIIQRLDKLESRVGAVETEQAITNGKLDMMTHMVYWGVAVIGLFLGFVAWLRPRETQTDNKPSRSELKDLMRDVVREMLPELKS